MSKSTQRGSAAGAAREAVRQVLEDRQQERAFSSRPLEMRANADGSLQFSGYACVFNVEYEVWGGPPWGWTESVNEGAFTKTLSEDPDVRLLINHDGMPLARTKSGTLSLEQDTVGLHSAAPLDANDPDVQRLQPKMARGDINQMSFAFYTMRQEWDEDYIRRWLVELSLDDGDVSIVTYPASPTTSADLRSLSLLSDRLSVEPERVLAELRAGGQDPLQLVRKAHRGIGRLAVAARAHRDDGAAADADDDPADIASAIDAAIDEALEAWADGNLDQAKALIMAAELASDALLALLGVADPDDQEGEANARRAALTERLMRRLDSAGINRDGKPRLSVVKRYLEVVSLRAV